MLLIYFLILLTFLDWGAAGVGTDDSNTGKWADSLIGDLVFPDKKPKEIIEGDDDPKDKDTNNEDVKGWFDGHPEIGKMQKNGNYAFALIQLINYLCTLCTYIRISWSCNSELIFWKNNCNI